MTDQTRPVKTDRIKITVLDEQAERNKAILHGHLDPMRRRHGLWTYHLESPVIQAFIPAPDHKYPVRVGKPSCGERPSCLGCPYARITGCAKTAS